MQKIPHKPPTHGAEKIGLEKTESYPQDKVGHFTPHLHKNVPP